MGTVFLSALMLLAQAAGGGGVPAGESSAAIRQPSRSVLPPDSLSALAAPAPILLAQADPGAKPPAAAPAAEPAAAPAAEAAEEPAGEAAEEDGGDPPQQPSLMHFLFPFIAIGFLFYFLLIRPQRRKEQHKRQGMIAALKKNVHVVTIGGIHGVVTNVQKEADEVTIKVDETSNTKLRVTLGSIARIVGDEPSGGASSKQ